MFNFVCSSCKTCKKINILENSYCRYMAETLLNCQINAEENQTLTFWSFFLSHSFHWDLSSSVMFLFHLPVIFAADF